MKSNKGYLSQTGVMKPPAEKSAKVHNAAGSGSRPGPSRHKVMSTAPDGAAEQRSLGGRKTKSALM